MGCRKAPVNVSDAGSVRSTPRPVLDDNKTNKGFAEFQIAPGNAYERLSFALCCHAVCVRSRRASSRSATRMVRRA